jgi:shikimate kinase
MGAGKTTIGHKVAARLGRVFVDLDHEIERRAGREILRIFAEDGEPGFRALEERVAAEILGAAEPAVVALGGGAVLSADTREVLKRRAFNILLDVDTHTAWSRSRATGRPLAVDETRFHALHRERQPVYEAAADASAQDVDGVLLAAAAVHVESGGLDRLAEIVPGQGQVELVLDARVNGIHGARAQVGLEARDIATHEVPAGEPAKAAAVLESLWNRFTIGRDGTIVAVGGGTTTDVAGFAAATYKRGVAWVPVPTTLVGQVGRQEPRGGVPLAGAGRDRPVAPGDAAGGGDPERDGRSREDRPAHG